MSTRRSATRSSASTGRAGEQPGWCFVDLFCGCGGASCGAVLAGYRVVLAVDAWKEAISCHERNHPECKHMVTTLPDGEGDIESLVAAEKAKGAHVHVHVSPPCQALSSANFANHRANSDSDAKSVAHTAAMRLVMWAIDFARRTGDTWSLEQVVRKEITRALRERGVDHCVVDASFFGVGQQRRRLMAGSEAFVRGVRSVMEDPLARRTTVQEVMATKGTHMRNRVYSTTALSEDGSKRLVVPASVEAQLRPFDAPSWTITGNSPPRWYCVDTKKNTYLTHEEMATLQGFPQGYDFDGVKTTKGRSVLIGNAVPPPVIRAGLKSVRDEACR